MKSLNFFRRLRFLTKKRGKFNGSVQRHFSLMSFRLVWSITYEKIMCLKNPLAQHLTTMSTCDPEKMSFNEVPVRKLRKQVWYAWIRPKKTTRWRNFQIKSPYSYKLFGFKIRKTGYLSLNTVGNTIKLLPQLTSFIVGWCR